MSESIKKRLTTLVASVWGILTAYSIYVVLGLPAEFPQIMIFFNLIIICQFSAMYPVYRYFGWEFA
ncbi:hypothetical protein [Halosimplex pelagicum]|uniref:Uncharacterized protein n=1 Tax=Halosimplex pelagicum TaxID=869886 RepID=A0A7D5T924_9EURY|nr:hypothetical protein [Halosimplex pelagicum]QLH80249.1 hypothetical protein HZS54_00800 [Halosimplex pelagicum]